jgi:hypothetical protein
VHEGPKDVGAALDVGVIRGPAEALGDGVHHDAVSVVR